jgi:hypothetical protein
MARVKKIALNATTNAEPHIPEWAQRGRPVNGRTSATPPLTAEGLLAYSGLLAAAEVTVTGTLPTGNPTETVTHFIIDTSKKAIVSQVVLPNAVQQNNSVSMTVRVPGTAAGPYAIGAFDADGNFQPSSFLNVTGPTGARAPAGGVR